MIWEKEESEFMTNAGKFRIFHNSKKVDIGNGKERKKTTIPFYRIQPANLSSRPYIPSDSSFWQQQYDKYAN